MTTPLEIIIEDFGKLDIAEACKKSGAALREGSGGPKTVILPFLDNEYIISFPDAKISSGGREIKNTGIIILLLHYLLTSKGTPLTGRLVDFRQVPDGNFYYPAFETIIHKPFLAMFGKEPGRFPEAGRSAGGTETDLKDFSARFSIFPRVQVTAVLHAGDSEFPAECKFLFDSSVSDYLPTEAVMKACGELIKKFKDAE